MHSNQLTMTAMCKSLLLVAHDFPPRCSAGSHRPAQFAKYLPDHGWRSYVLSAELRSGERSDPALLEQLELGDRVTRTRKVAIDRADDFVRGLYQKFKRDRRSEASSYLLQRRGSRGGRSHSSLPWDLGKTLRKWILFPDRFAGWIPFAIRAGERIVRKNDINVIFSTSKPVSAHVVAHQIKQRTDIAWVADFRDPWTYNPYRRDQGSLRWKVDRWLQDRLLKDADAVTTVTDPWRDMMRRQFGDNEPEKYLTVMNAFDPEDYSGSVSAEEEVFRLVYTGVFYTGKRDPTPLFKVVRNLLDAGLIEPDKFRIDIAGQPNAAIVALVSAFGLDGVVDMRGHIPHARAVDLQRRATALLMIQSQINPGGCPGKMFEYLGARRPILALVEPGGVVDGIIAETSSGASITPSDERGLRETLLEWYQSFEENGTLPIEPSEEAICRYARPYRTRKLADVFDEIAERSPRRTIL